MTTAVERFLKYVSYDTQSDEAYDTCPSTEKQLLLANELKRELEEMGASDVRMSEYGYLFARIPDNTRCIRRWTENHHPGTWLHFPHRHRAVLNRNKRKAAHRPGI